MFGFSCRLKLIGTHFFVESSQSEFILRATFRDIKRPRVELNKETFFIEPSGKTITINSSIIPLGSMVFLNIRAVCVCANKTAF